MKRLYKINLLLCISLIFVFIANTKEIKAKEIKTTYTTMDTLTSKNEKTIFSNYEIETIITKSIDKALNKESSSHINHLDRKVDIDFVVNEDDGNIETIINNGIYNFLNLTKEIKLYDFEFNIIVRYRDINGRYLRKEMYLYGFKKETLLNIDWNTVKIKNFVKKADKYTIDNGIKEKEVKEDEFKIKILEIIKFYLKQKISNKN